MIVELDDNLTQMSIWGDKLARLATGSVSSLWLRPNNPDEKDFTDESMFELTCFVCERRWVGLRQPLLELMGTHPHDARKHVDWFLSHWGPWPDEFVELLKSLLATLDETGVEGQKRFQELSERLHFTGDLDG